MFKKILIALVVAVALFAIVAAMQPSTFHVERSLVMKAGAEEIYTQVNDLKKWNAWSPWAKLDPNAQVTFSGPYTGVDAAMTWKGNSDMGEGTMTITRSKPYDVVEFRLDFKEPFAGTSSSAFTFKQEGDQTMVTWTMDGKNDFIGKAISLVYDCETMIGEKYEEGLASLRTIVEKK